MGLKSLGNVEGQPANSAPSISLDSDATPALEQAGEQNREWAHYGLIAHPQHIGETSTSADCFSPRVDPWITLTLSIIHQSLKDAEQGDHNALVWLINEGRALLDKLGISNTVVDNWASKL